MNKEIILVCKRVRYYAPLDEDMFFEWMSRIKAIIKCDGIGDELYL